MSNIWVFLLIAVIIIFLIRSRLFAGSDPLPVNDHMIMFIGGTGAGKTYCSVTTGKAILKKHILHYRLYRLFPRLVYALNPSWSVEPKIYSTYPIVKYYKKTKLSEYLKMKFSSILNTFRLLFIRKSERDRLINTGYRKIKVRRFIPVFYPVLKPAHILGSEKCEEGSVWIISEAGRLFPQWDFNNPVVCESIANTFALSRHFFNGTIIFDDQSSDNLLKAIRTRVGMIYHLSDFHRMLGILPWGKARYVPMLSIDGQSSELSTSDYAFEHWFYFKLPYSWQYKKFYYESRFFKKMYGGKAVRTVDSFDDFYTNYMLDFSVNQQIIDSYVKNKREFKRRILYDSSFVLNPDTLTFAGGSGSTGGASRPGGKKVDTSEFIKSGK